MGVGVRIRAVKNEPRVALQGIRKGQHAVHEVGNPAVGFDRKILWTICVLPLQVNTKHRQETRSPRRNQVVLIAL